MVSAQQAIPAYTEWCIGSGMRKAFSVSSYVRFNGTILLVSHIKQAAWVPIGGEIEAGETPLDALVRETKEEMGWQLDRDYVLPPPQFPGEPPGLLGYEEHDARSKGWHMNFAFLLEAKHQSIVSCDEFTQTAWVTTPYQVTPVPPNVHHLVLKALARTPAPV